LPGFRFSTPPPSAAASFAPSRGGLQSLKHVLPLAAVAGLKMGPPVNQLTQGFSSVGPQGKKVVTGTKPDMFVGVQDGSWLTPFQPVLERPDVPNELGETAGNGNDVLLEAQGCSSGE